jgi:hypothetical protein
MKGYKELRIVLDEETHQKFRDSCMRNLKTMKTVILELVDKYIRKGE